MNLDLGLPYAAQGALSILSLQGNFCISNVNI